MAEVDAVAVAAASLRRGCCVPILSFLHVPGKMSKPTWLMMGTAFAFRTPTWTPPSSACGGAALLLTAKHTFSPWAFTKDAAQLKIPSDFQKPRFVIGRMYATDADGRAVATAPTALRLLAQHPTLDVALLATDAPATAKTAQGEELAMAALPLRTTPYPATSTGQLWGYRGVGRLGELDTLDPSVLERLPPQERDALLKDLQDVEGKQVQAGTTVSVLDDRGMCKGIGALSTCYHGMSGGPLVTTAGECAGVLYGHHPDAPGCIGYTPTTDFAAWLEQEVQRHAARRDTTSSS